jgi:hypothetical protein
VVVEDFTTTFQAMECSITTITAITATTAIRLVFVDYLQDFVD